MGIKLVHSECSLIKTLTEQGYDYLPIHKEQDLVDNLRVQLQRLNYYTFTDSEWKRFFSEVIANQNEGIEGSILSISARQ